MATIYSRRVYVKLVQFLGGKPGQRTRVNGQLSDLILTGHLYHHGITPNQETRDQGRTGEGQKKKQGDRGKNLKKKGKGEIK